MRKIILPWKTFKLLLKGDRLTILQVEQYVFCITNTYLRSLAFKVGKLDQLSYAPNQDRHRRNQMVLWVHETTLKTFCGSHMLKEVRGSRFP
jgi:hypothetical protein